MNVTFQKLNTAYRPSVPAQTRQTPKAGKVKGDYDTVNIRRSRLHRKMTKPLPGCLPEKLPLS